MAHEAFQQVSVNRHDQLGGTTLLGDDTSEQELLNDSLIYPKNIQSQDEPDIGPSEECLPNLPGPQAWPPHKAGVPCLIRSRDQ